MTPTVRFFTGWILIPPGDAAAAGLLVAALLDELLLFELQASSNAAASATPVASSLRDGRCFMRGSLLYCKVRRCGVLSLPFTSFLRTPPQAPSASGTAAFCPRRAARRALTNKA